MKKIALLTFFSMASLFASGIYATFDVKAQQSANVAFSSGGIVKEIKVDIGSEVKKDEVIASLQNDDIKALLKANETTLKYAKKDIDRQKRVKNIIDKERFDKYSYKYESAKARFDYQKALFDKTTLKAPFDGIIISKYIEIGDVVSGQMIKTAFGVQSLDDRKLVLKFDQKYHNMVKKGDTFKYKVDGDSKEYEGVISKVYPTIDTKSRKMLAEVKAKGIPVGLFGNGYIIIKEK